MRTDPGHVTELGDIVRSVTVVAGNRNQEVLIEIPWRFNYAIKAIMGRK